MSKPIKYIITRGQGLLAMICILLCIFACKEEKIAHNGIIPQPQSIVQENGLLLISELLQINYSTTDLKEKAVYLQNALQKETGKNCSLTTESTPLANSINLQLVDGMEPEEYLLDITNKQINCQASTEAGIFYGIQSLLQLITFQNGTYILPVVQIADKPAYEWRGFMLDEVRHFFGKETVMQYLDIMSRLKLNRFHWHLTDEQAWRVEIKKYPLLTSVGSTGSWSDKDAPSRFYTQEEIREIIIYAAERHIMIIPEIDMPGHATAASRAYPYLSGGGEGKWNGFTFHPAKESTYEFVENVLTEIAALFPGDYINIGGDEVHYGNQEWFTDPLIQRFIKKNQLGDEIGLEHYFVRRVNDMVVKLGKKVIGWDEIIYAGISPEHAIPLWWRHDKPGVLADALNKGFNVIMCPRIPYYFDFVQDDTHQIGRRWEGNFNTQERVYHFNDSVAALIKGHEAQILGMQANMWAERIPDKKRLDYMYFPRILGLAENAWGGKVEKDFEAFKERTKGFMKYLDKEQINYFNIFDKESTPEPWGPDREDVIAEG